MHIVHCLFTLRTGGAQILTLNLLNELVDGHDVSLIVVNDQYMSSLLVGLDHRVQVYFLERQEGSRNPLPILRLNWLLHQLKPDIVHCHERKMVQLLKTSRAKTVYTVHDVRIPADTFASYDALVAISEAVADDVRQRTDLPIRVIHNGVPIQRFSRRTQYSLGPDEPIRIVQTGRLMHEKKGQHILLEALSLLVHQHGETRLQLDFIGEGDSLTYLNELTRSLRLDSYVRFRGHRDWTWLQANLSTYHLLVQPSIYEGFGLTVVEGLAAGLPVLVSDAGGPAEIVRSLAGGLLFTTEDAGSCVDALLRLIRAYRTQTVTDLVGVPALTNDGAYSIRAMANQYVDLYQQLLTNRTAPPAEALDPSTYFSPA
ncbi:glycosyltransferase family 4 protein [Spirosoma rhododendri]|uniref:Glycosyltransferase family 4 protein n=1 Tax=Spirosoma rhododendri TaxID=2728024 RepID=A0A7L5DLC3_9BACT|nr:glycosyltransferase family 4 protein [Spirosoma rhododendri]QJD77228.1 glycosyltransferase family 4 protein [Spirosoma rhododendri]